jgi:hypothetical protein
MYVLVVCRSQPQSTHHLFEADTAIALRHVWDMYLDLRILLRKALAHARVIIHEPKERLEDANAFQILCVKSRGSAGVTLTCKTPVV